MRHKTGNGHSVDLDVFLEDIKTVVHDGQELLKSGASDVKAKTLAGVRATDKAIRQNPYQTIGLVFGMGVVVGLIASGWFSAEASEPGDA